MNNALIIEDDEWAATILRLQLESAGFAVDTARLAEDGLRRAAERPPGVILLDLMLPGMSGWEALRQLKADPALAAVPVIILSAAADEKQGLAAGAARVLNKPIRRTDLLAALTEVRALAAGTARIRLLLAGRPGHAVETAVLSLDDARFEVLRAPDASTIQQAAEALLPDAVLFDAAPGADAAQAAIARLRNAAGSFRIPVLLVGEAAPAGMAHNVATLAPADLDRLGARLEEIAAHSPQSDY